MNRAEERSSRPNDSGESDGRRAGGAVNNTPPLPSALTGHGEPRCFWITDPVRRLRERFALVTATAAMCDFGSEYLKYFTMTPPSMADDLAWLVPSLHGGWEDERHASHTPARGRDSRGKPHARSVERYPERLNLGIDSLSYQNTLTFLSQELKNKLEQEAQLALKHLDFATKALKDMLEQIEQIGAQNSDTKIIIRYSNVCFKNAKFYSTDTWEHLANVQSLSTMHVFGDTDMQVGDVAEFHDYTLNNVPIYPRYAGEALQLIYNQKGALVALKMLTRAQYHSSVTRRAKKWSLCEPNEMILCLDSMVSVKLFLHENFESFVENVALKMF
ncbi:MAG: hypothetical protein SGPRY_007137 [Prymnesium sp.]